MLAINSKPVINVENKILKVGDNFDPMNEVTSIDKEDGDITKYIKVIENNVDTSKSGIYKVVYEVKDSKGAKTTKTITVAVIQENTTIGGNKPSNNTNSNSEKPQTGNIGILGFFVLGVASLVELFINKRSKRN